MSEDFEHRSRLTAIGGMSGAVAGLALLVVVALYPFVVPLQFEPAANLLKSLPSSQSQTIFRFVFWALTIIALLTISTFLGLYRLLRHPGLSLSGAVIAIVSSAMSSVSLIIYATTMPELAAAYASVVDQDLLRAIEFQASAFDALAIGILGVATLLFGLSLVLWSRAMSRELSRYGLPTLLVGIVAFVTVLSLVLGEMIFLLIFLAFEGVWLVVIGVKMASLSQPRAAI
ncbi:hypothetical protein E6H34_10795 [Candidatus Bathyarchaeota archaeon]|nr:MAG: hypothetical protein E6H34_10795 [Candidatus Bathyarchaeota archaeon]